MNIVTPFFQQCAQAPDKTVFVAEEQTISYIDFKIRIEKAGSRYFCESLFWASQPKQAAKT